MNESLSEILPVLITVVGGLGLACGLSIVLTVLIDIRSEWSTITGGPSNLYVQYVALMNRRARISSAAGAILILLGLVLNQHMMQWQLYTVFAVAFGVAIAISRSNATDIKNRTY